MEILTLVVLGGIAIFIVSRLISSSRGFADPTPMSSQQIIGAIAGQADWLEKMSRVPYESQRAPSIVALAQRRRNYIAQLYVELLSRSPSSSEPSYPGASKPLDIFAEAREFAKELEQSGSSAELEAVRAVKEKLFKQNGHVYPASWENEVYQARVWDALPPQP